MQEFDEDAVIWVNPGDEDEAYTLGDLFRLLEIQAAVLRFLGKQEDMHEDALERFYDDMEQLEIAPNPCPICGKYSEHVHTM